MRHFQLAVRDLLKMVGPTLIALAAGSSERNIAQKWLTDERMPTRTDEQRIFFTLNILRKVSEAESEDVARAWFIGANCDGMTRAPVELVREDRYREVEASASQLLSDSFS